jgi:hypothetical protein
VTHFVWDAVFFQRANDKLGMVHIIFHQHHEQGLSIHESLLAMDEDILTLNGFPGMCWLESETNRCRSTTEMWVFQVMI